MVRDKNCHKNRERALGHSDWDPTKTVPICRLIKIITAPAWCFYPARSKPCHHIGALIVVVGVIEEHPLDTP